MTDKLTPRDEAILELRKEGYSYLAIGIEFDISVSRVSQIMKRIKQKLRILEIENEGA